MKTLPVPLSHVVAPPVRLDTPEPKGDQGDKGFARHLQGRADHEQNTVMAHGDRSLPGESNAHAVPGAESARQEALDILPVHIDVYESASPTTSETIYPLTLAVVGYLSMLAGKGPEAMPPGFPDHAEKTASHALPTGNDDSAAPLAPIDHSVAMVDEHEPVPGEDASMRAMDMEAPTATMEAMAWPAAPSPWSRRRLTLEGDADGTTLRLRDYALTSSDAEDAAQAIREQARQSGITLSRVVVNARDIEGKGTT